MEIISKSVGNFLVIIVLTNFGDARNVGVSCLQQQFSNFFDYGPLFSSGIVGGPPHTCYSKIYCKILKFLGILLFTDKPTSSIMYKLQWKASNVSVMDVLASLCTDCQFCQFGS